MTLQELIRDLADYYQNQAGQPQLTQRILRDIVQRVIDGITTGLVKDEVVNLGDLGKFEVKTRKERRGRNPRTGEALIIPGKKAVVFRPAQRLKERVGGAVVETAAAPPQATASPT